MKLYPHPNGSVAIEPTQNLVDVSSGCTLQYSFVDAYTWLENFDRSMKQPDVSKKECQQKDSLAEPSKPTKPRRSHILDLPNEVLTPITEQLRAIDLVHLSATCQIWENWLREERPQRYFRDMLEMEEIKDDLPYKKMYWSPWIRAQCVPCYTCCRIKTRESFLPEMLRGAFAPRWGHRFPERFCVDCVLDGRALPGFNKLFHKQYILFDTGFSWVEGSFVQPMPRPFGGFRLAHCTSCNRASWRPEEQWVGVPRKQRQLRLCTFCYQRRTSPDRLDARPTITQFILPTDWLDYFPLKGHPGSGWYSPSYLYRVYNLRGSFDYDLWKKKRNRKDGHRPHRRSVSLKYTTSSARAEFWQRYISKPSKTSQKRHDLRSRGVQTPLNAYKRRMIRQTRFDRSGRPWVL